jgi:SAM-dependent methyltransferase
MVKLNLGCGGQVVEGWTNVDYALGARLATTPLLGQTVRRLKLFQLEWNPKIHIHDLTKPLPWEDDSVDSCYTSHTVEHLSRDEGSRLVREAFRVLKPGGVLRVVVPDLRAIVDRYLSGGLAADHFVEDLGVLYGPAKQGLARLLAPVVEFPHKCMYDSATMRRVLQSAGFVARCRPPFESDIVDIRSIEISDRTVDAVIVEGNKPALTPTARTA